MRLLTLLITTTLLLSFTACVRERPMTPADIRKSLAGGCFQSNMKGGGLTADRVRAYCDCYAEELTTLMPPQDLLAINDDPAAAKSNAILEESRNKCLMKHLIPED